MLPSPSVNELESNANTPVCNPHQITATPTLLSFSRQEAQLQTKLTSVAEMKDREFLRLWIEDEARRGGSGGGSGTGLFGGLFGLGGGR